MSIVPFRGCARYGFELTSICSQLSDKSGRLDSVVRKNGTTAEEK